MILKKYTNRMILTISTLTILITNTPTKIKAYIPPIKGLYEIFTPDVIGIGQALKAKGWIENVYDFAPEDNLAKKVITSFWHKVSENEQLKPTELAPVSEITPQILGQILKYIRTFKNGNKEEYEKEREKIAEAWYSQCKNYIENKLPNKVDRDIEKAIEELNKKNDENTKKIASNKNTEEIKSELKKLDSEIEKLKKKVKTLTKENQASEAEIKKTELKEKEESRTKNQLLLKEIEKAIKEIQGFQEKLKKFNDNDLPAKEIEKRTKSIETNTTKIIEEIEKLAASKDFIPETAEAILWAFFEDKFTQDKALKNLLLCLKELDEKKLNAMKSIEFYAPEKSNEFANTIKNLNDTNKINKIIEKYDQSTYSSIKKARTKNFSPVVRSPRMKFQYNNNEIPNNDFATCFESAILDTLSILLYNATNKTYDLTLLPDSSRSSKFFINTIEQVFKEKTNSEALINPSDINDKFQNWINIIENKPGIEYHDKKEIDDEIIGYNLNTRIENLIKILNEFFNLGLEIEYNQQDPKILEISNFKNIMNELNKTNEPKDAQDFLNEIFKFISKKLSTDVQKQTNENSRKITFSCKLDSSSKPSFEISENKIKINGSFGIINIKTESHNLNIDFDLHIEPTHASVKFPARDNITPNCFTITINFKELLKKNIYDEKNKQKLLPLFILLADLNTLEETDIKMQNLLFYCMPLKEDQDKLKFIKTIAEKGLFENQSFKKSKQQFIDKIVTNEQLISHLLNSIPNIRTRNKTIDIIIDQAIKKEPNYLLTRILSNTSIDWKENIAIKIINKIKLSFDSIYTALNYALTNKKTDIIKILSEKYPMDVLNILITINHELSTDIALKIINEKKYLNNPEAYKSLLKNAISSKHENIFEILLKNKDQFEATLKTIPEEILIETINSKKSWITDIALKIIDKNPNLDINKKTENQNSILDEVASSYINLNYYNPDIIKALSKKHSYDIILKLIRKNMDKETIEMIIDLIKENDLTEEINTKKYSKATNLGIKAIENDNIDITKELAKKYPIDILLSIVKQNLGDNKNKSEFENIAINIIKESDLIEKSKIHKLNLIGYFWISALKNKLTNITETLEKKYPENILIIIVNNKPDEFKNSALKIINDNPNIDLTKTDIKGNSILDYAIKNGHKDITDALSKLKTKNNHENKN